jgi:hypothetical protein
VLPAMASEHQVGQQAGTPGSTIGPDHVAAPWDGRPSIGTPPKRGHVRLLREFARWAMPEHVQRAGPCATCAAGQDKIILELQSGRA